MLFYSDVDPQSLCIFIGPPWYDLRKDGHLGDSSSECGNNRFCECCRILLRKDQAFETVGREGFGECSGQDPTRLSGFSGMFLWRFDCADTLFCRAYGCGSAGLFRLWSGRYKLNDLFFDWRHFAFSDSLEFHKALQRSCC